MVKYFVLAAYISTVPLANWMIGNIGLCVKPDICLVPVAPEIMAPSGVLAIGLAFVLRNFMQDLWGIKITLIAMAAGAALSGFVSPPALVVASMSAFILAEIADMAVYTPLKQKGMTIALLASCFAGAVIDSAVFLWVAFGSLDYIVGEVIGKSYAAVFAAIIMKVIRK